MKRSLKILNSLKEAQSGPAAKISILAGIFPVISFCRDLFSLEFSKVFDGLIEAYRSKLSYPIFEIFHQIGIGVSPIFIDWFLFYLMFGMAYVWSYESKFPIQKHLRSTRDFLDSMRNLITTRRERSSAFINDVIFWFVFKVCMFLRWFLKTSFCHFFVYFLSVLSWMVASMRRILFWPILCIRYPFLFENSEIGMFRSKNYTDVRRPAHEVFSEMRRERAKQLNHWVVLPDGACAMLSSKLGRLSFLLLFAYIFIFFVNVIIMLFILLFMIFIPDCTVNHVRNNIEGVYVGDMRLIFLFKIVITFMGALIICMFSYVGK